MKTVYFTAVLLVLATMTGCGMAKKSSAQDVLSGMESYSARAEVTYISNKGENTCDTVQYAKKDGRYRIDTLAPEEYKGISVIYDGKLVWQTVAGEKYKIKVASNNTERALPLLYSFWENHSRSAEDAAVTPSARPGGRVTVLEADIPGGSRTFAAEKLWFDEEKGVPERLVVFNDEGKEKIVVKFADFKYNENIEDSVFSPIEQSKKEE